MLTTISGILFISGITGSIVMQKYRMRNSQTSNSNTVNESSTQQSSQYQQPLSSVQENTRHQTPENPDNLTDKNITH